MKLAERLHSFTEPQTLRMAKLARELRAEGADIIDLSLGEPDFCTPRHICEAATKAMADCYTKYPPVAGFLELREAVCRKLKRDNSLSYEPNQIIVSTGAKQCLANLAMCVINPGDEVIIPTPYWVTYSSLVQLAEGTPVFAHCGIEQQFKLKPEQLEAAITPRTRMFIFSSPCNPTGSVYSYEELKALAAVFAKHPEIVVVSDEIYEYINFTGGKHESIAQFEEIKDQVVVVNGFSKGFAMTGWRLGYMAAPLPLAQACDKLQAQFTSGANSVAQRAAITALDADLTPTREMTRAFHERRDYMIPALRSIEGMQVAEPEGAFYAFPNISHYFGKSNGTYTIQNDEEMSMYLLHEAHISSVNGGAFGNENCIRFSFANSMDNLKRAMERLEKALGQLQ